MRRPFPQGLWMRPAQVLTRGDMSAILTPGEGGFVAALLAARGAVLSQEELIAGLWPHADGGPLTAADVLRQWTDRARPKVAPLGIEIVVRRSFGYAARVTP